MSFDFNFLDCGKTIDLLPCLFILMYGETESTCCILTIILLFVHAIQTILLISDMKSFANHGNAEQYVSLGQALVIDLPPIDCYPAPSIEWFDGSIALIPREQFLYHVTLKNQLVILEARNTLERRVFKARATNIYSQRTSDSQLFVIRVQSNGIRTDFSNLCTLCYNVQYGWPLSSEHQAEKFWVFGCPPRTSTIGNISV